MRSILSVAAAVLAAAIAYDMIHAALRRIAGRGLWGLRYEAPLRALDLSGLPRKVPARLWLGRRLVCGGPSRSRRPAAAAQRK